MPGGFHRFVIAHHAVLSIQMEGHADAVIVQGEVACDAGLYLFKNIIDSGNHDRIARSGNGQAAETDPPRAFQLQRVRRRFMTRTADVNLAFVDGFEGASFQVQHAARTGQEIRIGLLVQRMRRRRGFGKLTLWIKRFQRKAAVVDNPHGAVGTGARRGGNGRAFEDLAAVQGEPLVKALHNRQRREAGRIVCPAAKHHRAPAASAR